MLNCGIDFDNESQLRHVVAELVSIRCYFTVEPHHENKWLVVVKSEREKIVRKLKNEWCKYSDGAMHDNRTEAANHAFYAYDFGTGVEDSGGWEYDQDTMSKTVFLENEGKPSRAVKFIVEFEVAGSVIDNIHVE